MSDYPTYFIRHTKKLNVDDATLQRLRNEHKVAIHFPWTGTKKTYDRPDSRSTDPADYKTDNARRALQALGDLAETGGYVLAEFHDTEDCLIGFIRPRTKVALVEGRWRTKDRKAILKSLAVVESKVIPRSKLLHLLVCCPRQRTISPWPKIKKCVEHLARNKRPARDELFDYLLPGQQEVMCEEYLRSHEAGDDLPILRYLLLPVGRQMKDIDIYGIGTEGKRIIAQVTHHDLNHAKKKLRRLCEYRGPDTELILFCNEDAPTTQSGVLIVPLKQIYDAFVKTDAGRAWQKDILLVT